VFFWFWHAPDAYVAALDATPVYWLMQLTLLGSAALMWAAIFAATPARAIAALLGLTIQMGLLGALLVFAATPLYAPHLTTTLAFGLDPEADQQLAGLIMWVPACLPYLAAGLHRLAAALRDPAGART
jgi:putative membrane protein